MPRLLPILFVAVLAAITANGIAPVTSSSCAPGPPGEEKYRPTTLSLALLQLDAGQDAGHSDAAAAAAAALLFAQVHVEAARGADLVVFPAGRTMRGSDHACGAVFAAAADAARAAAVTIAATCGRELVLLEGTTGTELLRQDGNGSGSVARLRTRAGAPYVLGVVLGSAGLWAPLVSRELMLQGAEVVVAATDDPGEDPLRALLITRGFVRTTALPIKPTTDDRYEREASSRCTLLLRLHSNYYTAFTRITDRHWARHVRTASLRTRDVPHCGIAGERRRGGTCKPRRRVCGCELV